MKSKISKRTNRKGKNKIDRSRTVFGNRIRSDMYLEACFSKDRFVLKFGDDTKELYHLKAVKNAILGKYMGVKGLEKSNKKLVLKDKNPVIIANIRMGFGHYRISMAIASCAAAIGCTPYWLDLNSFPDTTGGKIIRYLNDMYSLGSRLSQRFYLFDKLIWEPGSRNAYKKLSSNAVDQKNSELMTRVYQDIDKDIPVIATHVWPAQAAVHANMKNVVNVVPDNFPMALHLAEGAVHTVQTPSSYFGYMTLNEMGEDKNVKPMAKDDIVYAGHYVDHDIVQNINEDCDKRYLRISKGEPLRFLIVVGGAGAGLSMIINIIKKLIKSVKENKACIILNLGDHINILDEIKKNIKDFEGIMTLHEYDFSKTEEFIKDYESNIMTGIHVFYHKDIYAAVYSTNLFMRISDVLVTKPSELAFYPIPKLLIRRVGGHEAYGALRSSEIGDGTIECRTYNMANQMLDIMVKDPSVINTMCENIKRANKIRVYDGGYEVVRTALKLKEKNNS